jgi:hypothetical protein
MAASLTTQLTTGAAAISGIGAAASTISGIASASRLTSAGLTAGAESVGDILGAVSMFSDLGNADDWRVRLSLPYWPSFRTSPVLQPLADAGGMVFPYTPEVSFSTAAKYSAIPTTHSNYQFQAYENSAPGQITITAPMNVEDTTQALYWIASLHYFRSITKMFSGFDMKAGNPPPVVFLNGYGSYVFRNVPVVITNFQTSLSKDCDYISCDPKASVMAVAGGLADSLGGLAETLGLSSLSSLTDGLGNVGGILGAFGAGGSTDAGKAHVPTKSTFTVTLQPMYSRSSARKFSLDRFVTGGYVQSAFGYI